MISLLLSLLANDIANQLFYFLKGKPNVGRFVAQIRPQSQINNVLVSHQG